MMTELGLTDARRKEIAASLAHLDRCDACRSAMGDYNRIQAVLKTSADLSEVEPRGGWMAFEERLQSTLPRSTAKPSIAPRPKFSRSLRPLGVSAAAALLAVGGYFWGALRSRHTGNGLANGPSAIIASLSSSDVTHQMRAFDEVDQVFEGRTRWLLLTGGEADVSLEEGSRESTSRGNEKVKQRIVLLRLDLLRVGEVVSTADLLIVAGKTAEVRLPMKDGTSLRYRLATSGRDPSQLTLRAELRSGGGAEAQASLATDLQLQPDRGTSAGQLTVPSGQYDVKVLYASASNDIPGAKP